MNKVLLHLLHFIQHKKHMEEREQEFRMALKVYNTRFKKAFFKKQAPTWGLCFGTQDDLQQWQSSLFPQHFSSLQVQSWERDRSGKGLQHFSAYFPVPSPRCCLTPGASMLLSAGGRAGSRLEGPAGNSLGFAGPNPTSKRVDNCTLPCLMWAAAAAQVCSSHHVQDSKPLLLPRWKGVELNPIISC